MRYIFKIYQLVKQYKVLITTKENWCITGKIVDSIFFIWHTEWSRHNNRFGAGVYGPGDNHSEDIPIGSLYTGGRGREDTCVQGFGGETWMERDTFEDLVLDGKIILKYKGNGLYRSGLE